jgi:hypothetical protein
MTARVKKDKLPVWVHGHLEKWLADPSDPLSGSTFADIVAYKTKGQWSASLDLALTDFGFTHTELMRLTAQEMAEEVLARGVLTAQEMREMEENCV